MLREARLNQGILLGKMASQSHDKKQNMIDAIENLDSTLNLKRILNWHEKLFTKGHAQPYHGWPVTSYPITRKVV